MKKSITKNTADLIDKITVTTLFFLGFALSFFSCYGLVRYARKAIIFFFYAKECSLKM